MLLSTVFTVVFFRTIQKNPNTHSTEALHRVHGRASLYACIMVKIATKILIQLKDGREKPAGFNTHILPEGRFQARDGRPGNIKGSKTDSFYLDKEAGLILVQQIKARHSDMVVDYEHQSFEAKKNGAPAPAAGWIKGATYIEGSGLWVQVEWTAKAKAMIEADEYRYISPVMFFDLKTGHITEIINIALTNNPALDGLEAVAASLISLQNQKEEDSMDKFLEQLRALLGLQDKADEAAIVDAVTKALEKSKKPEGFSVDLSKYAPVEALTSLQAANEKMQATITSLQAQLNQDKSAASIQAALADGRLAPSLKEWAEQMAGENPAALEAYLKAASPIAALSGMQTDKSGPPPDKDKAKLTDEERYMAEQLGLAEDDFLKFASEKK